MVKPYFEFNTKLRMEAKNGFEKDFLKPMNNSVFSKTMESIRKHKNIKFVTNIDSCLNPISTGGGGGGRFPPHAQ